MASFLFLQLMFCPVVASLPEYLYFTGNGGSMYPTIKEGDRVEVKVGVDPATVNVDDIIVYGSIATAAYVPQPQAMWICHRVIEKFEEGETWCFRTKGDNNSEPDPWKVPAHWLLGIVTSIEHSSIPVEPPQANEEPLGIRPSDGQSNMLLIGGGVGLCLIIGVVATFLINGTKRREHERIFENGLCYRCRRYEAEFVYTLEHTDGRLGLRRAPSSRGFCKYHNTAVFDGTPASGCSRYEQRPTTD